MNAHVLILPRDMKNPPSDRSRGGFLPIIYNLVTVALAFAILLALVTLRSLNLFNTSSDVRCQIRLKRRGLSRGQLSSRYSCINFLGLKCN
jgi:hypothetical protein